MRRWGIGTVAFFAVTLLQAAVLNSPAPKFVLINSNQQRRTLASFKGKVVFINFWASWCAPCQVELPELKRLASEYSGKKLRVLAINVDTDRRAARRLLSNLGLTVSPLEILWDTKSKAVSAYNIETMPSSYILDPQGVIRFAHSGFHPHDPETWRSEVNQLLQ
jgi:thiol-disulfide isomerase/thioredoxin